MRNSLFLRNLVILNLVLCFFTGVASAEVTWEKTFGGTDADAGRAVQQTNDGGFIIAGTTSSFGEGESDVYLVKTDADGHQLWSKTFGGSYSDEGESVQQTNDDGYIIAGGTYSFGAESYDVYLVKTDPDGNELWSKTFGGSGWEEGRSVQQTNDDGYIITGRKSSFGSFVGDVYLVKTDPDGNELWSKTFGGIGEDQGLSVKQTTDGGYIITGGTGDYIYLVKTDPEGNELWSKTYRDGEYGFGFSVQQTDDGGYIISGYCNYPKPPYYIYQQICLVKTDANGNEMWKNTFGATYGSSYGRSVEQTHDGGYIITGNTDSFGAGSSDVYLVKTDPDGNELWSKTFGGSGWDGGFSVQQITGGGYIIAGWTYSSGAGSSDVYLIYYGPIFPGDFDGDGISDDMDDCLNSDLSPTVVIGGCDSLVPNTLFHDGCTISDNIAELADSSANHGKFTSSVSHLTNDLKKDGVITGKQKGAIQNCAGKAEIP